MHGSDRTAAQARDAQDAKRQGEYAGDLKLVREALEKNGHSVEFMNRTKCVPRILAAKNEQLGHPLGAAELEEVAQQTIIVIWKKLSTFEGRSSLETWIFQIAVFELMNRIRHSLRRRPTALSAKELEDAAGHEEPQGFEDYTFIYKALDTLPADEYAVVRKKHFENASFPEIGRALRISKNTAKTRYYRAMSRLRRELKDYEGELE